jgi:hypothetical protein
MIVAQPAKPIHRPIAITVTRLMALLDEDESDEYGVLRPNSLAFKIAMQFVVEAYDGLGDRFQQASVSTDDQGGICLTWNKANSEVRLVCPALVNQDAYLYHEVGDEYGIERDVTDVILVQWLEWLNQV